MPCRRQHEVPKQLKAYQQCQQAGMTCRAAFVWGLPGQLKQRLGSVRLGAGKSHISIDFHDNNGTSSMMMSLLSQCWCQEEADEGHQRVKHCLIHCKHGLPMKQLLDSCSNFVALQLWICTIKGLQMLRPAGCFQCCPGLQGSQRSSIGCL